jgi:Rrf2 family protein
MQLQITTDYAIRMIGYLALHKDQLVTARNMAGELGITYQYSMKVINQLKKESLIDSVQGCNGGYKLTEAAAQVTFYDIICLMEGDINLNRCIGEGRFCKRAPNDMCDIHKALQRLQDALIKDLKSIKIVDIFMREKNVKTATLKAIDELSQRG